MISAASSILVFQLNGGHQKRGKIKTFDAILRSLHRESEKKVNPNTLRIGWRGMTGSDGGSHREAEQMGAWCRTRGGAVKKKGAAARWSRDSYQNLFTMLVGTLKETKKISEPTADQRAPTTLVFFRRTWLVWKIPFPIEQSIVISSRTKNP
jgi:hypothetical protein